MENIVEEIKKRIDIVEFIGNFVPLKRSGRNFKALCPFHQEKTPSFIVSPERQIWRCFGACQEGGDVIKFLMKWENLTFYEAIKEFSLKLGIPLKKITIVDQQWKKKEKLMKINQLAADFYHYLLKNHSIGEKAREYLKKRKIKPKIIEVFNLGYAPSSWDSLLKFLRKKGIKEEEAYEAGLLVKNEKEEYYDRFRGRLIFPIKNPRGEIVGFSGRVLEEKDEAKYINTPETPLYHKKESLFGIELAKEAIIKNKNVFLVEGEFDMISCFQEGIENVVAVKGSAVTYEQLMILKRYTDRITLSLDADLAGEETTKRAIWDAEQLEFDVFVVSVDFAKDPDEAIKKDKEKFKKILEKPLPVYDFIFESVLKKYPEKTAIAKKNIANEIIPFLSRIKNPIVQSHYIKRLSEEVEVETSTVKLLIKKELNKQKGLIPMPSFLRKKTTRNRFLLLQTYLLSLIFQSDNPLPLAEKIFKILEKEDFSYPAYQKLIDIFFDFKNNLSEKKTFFVHWQKKFLTLVPPELISVYDEIFLFDISIFDSMIIEKKIERIILECKKLSLKEKIKEKKENLEEVKKLTTLLHQVEKQLTMM